MEMTEPRRSDRKRTQTDFLGGGWVFGGCTCRDCPFPSWLPSAPPAPAPSPAPRLVTPAATLAATASRLKDQPVTQYYDAGAGLSDGRAVDRDGSQPDAVELLLRRHTEAHPVRLDSSGAGPSDLRHCYMCETRDTVQWYYWPPKGGRNPGQPPHHRVCAACRASLHNGSLVKEQHRVSRCGLDYDCPGGSAYDRLVGLKELGEGGGRVWAVRSRPALHRVCSKRTSLLEAFVPTDSFSCPLQTGEALDEDRITDALLALVHATGCGNCLIWCASPVSL
jgi:hypothetical protein